MNNYLSEFQQQSRLRADPELIQRWESDARYNGDKQIKIELATAKRTATSLVKSAKQFSKLKPEHELAIRAAASAMRSLAEELSSLAIWAKAYKVFCDKRREIDVARMHDDFADKRWGADEVAFRFEHDLMQELCTMEGRIQFASWVHSTGQYLDIQLKDIYCKIDRIFSCGKTPKHRIAATLQDAESRSPDHVLGGSTKRSVFCSYSKYEDYLRYRKDVAKTARLMLESAKLPMPKVLGEQA